MRVQNRRKFRPSLDSMEPRQLLSHMAHMVAPPTPMNLRVAPVHVSHPSPKPLQSNTAALATATPTPGPLYLTPTPISTTEIDLRWTSSQYATTYAVMFRPSGSSAPFGHFDDTSSTSMAVTGLIPATRYEFYVIAFNMAGSNQSSVVTSTTATPPPGPVYISSVTQVSTTEIDLSWTKSQYATTYGVLYRPSGSSAMFGYFDSTTGTSMAVTRLAPATRYEFYVVAFNMTADAQSNVVTGTTVTPPPGPFYISSITQVSTTEIDLSWTNSQYAGTYGVLYRPSGSSAQFGYFDSTTGTSMAVTRLAPDTEYQFYVVVGNYSGSNQTSVVTAATL